MDGECGDCVFAFPEKPDNVINVKVEFGEGEGKVPLDAMAEQIVHCFVMTPTKWIA